MRVNWASAPMPMIGVTVLSALLHATYYYMTITRHVPNKTYPYWWSMLGSAVMIILPVAVWAEGSKRFGAIFSYATLLVGAMLCYFALTDSGVV